MSIPSKLSLSVFAVVLACMGSAVASQAATTVANTNDSGSGSLREAIEKAPAGETINLPAGEYNLTSDELFIGKNLTIAGAGAGSTKIGARNAFRVLDIESEGGKPISVTLSGLTVRQGAGLEEKKGEEAVGGGILAFETNLTLNGVAVTENRAEAQGDEEGGEASGGGLFVVLGSLNMQDTTVTDNIAKAEGGEEEGGGLAEGGGLVLTGTPLTMTNSNVSSNTAKAGGSRGPGDPGSTTEGGRAQGAGLAMIVGGESPSKISDSTFARNSAVADLGKDGSPGEAVGGGFYAAIGLGGPAGGAVSIANSTISGNSAAAPNGNAAGGGAIFGAVNGGSIAVTGATIAANKLESKSGLAEEGVENGGGNLVVVDEAPKVFEPGSVSIGGSILANGVSPGHANCNVIGKVVSLGYNIDSLDQCGFHATGDQVNTDPQLGPLAANGGLTETMLPATSSPAIDKSKSFGIGTDQRGVTRPIAFPSIADAAGGDGSDVGAAEVQPLGSLQIGKVVKNKKKGTATVTVIPAAPSLGSLVLKGKGLKTQKATVGSKPTIKLKLATKGGKAKALRKKGKLKVKFEVVYSPSNVAPVSKRGSTKLVLKAKPKRHEHGKR